MSGRGRPSRPRYGPPRRSAPGTPPGTLSIDPQAPPSQLHLVTFGPDSYRDTAHASLDDLAEPLEDGATRWLHVDGLGDADTLRVVGERFGLHPLALEDVVNVHQRPKFEDYEHHLFLVLRVPAPPADGAEAVPLHTEQVALWLGRDGVATFGEAPSEAFEPVRRRLRNATSQLRARGAGYLAYALIDAVVDAYFPLLEAYGERLEALENDVVGTPRAEHVHRIHQLKHDLLTVRRAVWPLRDLLAAVLRDDNALIDPHTRVYLRDCHDHTVQLIDVLETYREIASGLIDIHLSSVSNRMNEVMKVLTIIATIFIPLTFLAGIYGMNFDREAGAWSMPELGWVYGYPAVLLLMLAVALGLVVWFRRKGWIGGTSAT